MKKLNLGFTLVELIVVITIVAILSSIGFVSYTDYLRWVRDGSRLEQISSLHKALELHATRQKIPLSADMVAVSFSGAQIWTQWDLDQSVLDIIKYSDGGRDPKSKDFFTYIVSADRKSSQILAFFEEKNTDTFVLGNNVHAAENLSSYSSLYPWVFGSEIWVLMQQTTNIPIHKLESVILDNGLDLQSSTGSFVSYLTTQNKIVWANWNDYVGIVPNTSCKGIKALLWSTQSWIKKINPSWVQPIDVYCDMTTDWGGWTFAAHIDNDTNGTEISFNAPMWIYTSSMEDTNETYALNMAQLYHTEMMVLFDTSNVSTANTNSKFLQLKYDKFMNGMYMGPIVPCSNFFGSSTEFSYKTSINWSYLVSNQIQCHWTQWSLRPTPHNSSYLLAFRDFLSGDGLWTGARYDSNPWGIVSGQPGYDVSWEHDVWIFVR